MEKLYIFLYTISILTRSFNCDDDDTFSTEEPIEATTRKRPFRVKYDEAEEIFFSTMVIVLTFCIVVASWLCGFFSKGAYDILLARKDQKELEEREKMKTKVPELPENKETPGGIKDENKEEKEEVKKTVEEKETVSSALSKEQVEFIEEKKSAEKYWSSESKYRFLGSITMISQNTIQADLAANMNDDKPVKKSIKKVKWKPDPIIFYEVGPDVDRFQAMHDNKCVLSSSALTASIKEISKPWGSGSKVSM